MCTVKVFIQYFLPELHNCNSSSLHIVELHIKQLVDPPLVVGLLILVVCGYKVEPLVGNGDGRLIVVTGTSLEGSEDGRLAVVTGSTLVGSGDDR